MGGPNISWAAAGMALDFTLLLKKRIEILG
jgi:hypothetical protein